MRTAHTLQLKLNISIYQVDFARKLRRDIWSLSQLALVNHILGFMLFFSMLNVKQESCKYEFFVVFSLTRPGIERGSEESQSQKQTRYRLDQRMVLPCTMLVYSYNYSTVANMTSGRG